MEENNQQIQKRVYEKFSEIFGRTPLEERLKDILKQTMELTRFRDVLHLKEKTGDLLSSVLMLASESGFSAEELIEGCLAKIEERKIQYKSLGRKLQVALLGTSANPITNGHINIAQLVLNTSALFDEVWIMPCYSHMHGKDLASPDHRLEMCRIAAKKDGRIKVFDYEIKKQSSGETYHLVKHLLEEDFAKEKIEFSMILGQDVANGFDTWANFTELERILRFVVVSRKGVSEDSKTKWYLKPPHIYLKLEQEEEISSSLVRKLIKQKDEKVKTLIDKEVLEYISLHHLYE